MKKYKVICFLLAVAVTLTAACGKDGYVVEYGVDGCVYTARKLSAPDGMDDLKVSGDYMYFTQENKVKRFSIASLLAEGDVPDFSKPESILAVKPSAREIPEDIREAMQRGGFVFPERYGGEVGQDEIQYTFSLGDYCIDNEQNLYYFLQIFAGSYTEKEAAGGLLCRQSENGESIYQVYLPQLNGVAADNMGRAYALADGEIKVFGSEGKQLGAVSVSEYQDGNGDSPGELFGDSDGRVYYCAVSGFHARTGYEVVDDGSFRLRETGMFSGGSYEDHYAGVGGKRLLYAQSDNMVYEYDREKEETVEKFCLTDSGMKGFYVQSLVQATENHLLMVYGEPGDKSLYLLSKTQTEELSQKEHIVIASMTPSVELREAAASFNMLSSQYSITIDQYGAEYSETEGRWVYPMLDAGLVSSNPPDLLDLSQINISKYAEQGILEDLYPYLEESSKLSPADFLENMLEGMTIGGKLVCIPAYFNMKSVAGRCSRMEAIDSWTMDTLYELCEGQSAEGRELLNDGYGQGWTMEYLLGEFCAPYYLDAFVDWQNGICIFDSVEFGRLLEWVRKHASGPEDYSHAAGDVYIGFQYVPEKAVLVSGNMDFVGQIYLEAQCGEEVEWLGMPTLGGEGRVSVELNDAMAITSGSVHKEGAWQFLEYYLSSVKDGYGFPTKRAEIRELYEDAVTPVYAGGVLGEEDDEREMVVDYYMSIGGDRIPYYATPQEYADKVIAAIEAADFTPLSEEKEAVIQIVMEEAAEYCSGVKGLEEVTEVIQNKVQLLLNERGT